MPTLTIPMPDLPCFVRREYLRNLEDGHGEIEKCYAFAVSSRPGRALEFHVMTERGGVFQGVPICALQSHETRRADYTLSALQWWDCPSYDAVAVQLPFLRHRMATVLLRLESGGTPKVAEYFCTFDFYADQSQRIDCTHAEEPAEKKALHLLKLDVGQFCLAPNDKIRWAKDSWMENYHIAPDYKRNTHVWVAER